MSPVLSVREIKKIYPGKKPFLAVDGISFDLAKGEILGFLGPNGSGKTTTIQMLLGTLTPTSGTIRYFGKDFAQNRTEILRSVSFASTYLSLSYTLSVAENLDVLGFLYGMSRKESRGNFLPLLERFGILEYLHTRVANLSAGQVTRLMLVKAFFINPKVVLLDEPTASLDPDISQEICEFILDEKDKRGISILFTSHKMEEVAEVCDRVIFLERGKVIADDLPEKLAQSISRFRLRLVLGDGLEQAAALAQKKGHFHTIEHRTLEIDLEEKEIPLYLSSLAKEEIFYSSIQIKEPSLEDYFLKIARRKREY